MTFRPTDQGQVLSAPRRARRSSSSRQQSRAIALLPSSRAEVPDLKRQIKRLLKEKRSIEIDRESIQQECERYRKLYDAAPAGCVVTNARGKILEANADAERLLRNGARVKLHGAPLESFISSKELPRFREMLIAAIRDGRGAQCELFQYRSSKNGGARSLLLSIGPGNHDRRRRLHWLIQPRCWDHHRQFANGNEMLAAIVESCEDSIIALSPNGEVFAWNAAAERLFGYSANEMVGQSIMKIIPPERRSEERKILNRVRKGEQIRRYRTARLDRTGRSIDVSLTISPIRDAEGRILGVSKISHDITEYRRSEEALREGAERMRAIVDAAVDAIITIDERGTIESANLATQRLFNYASKELIGRNIKMLMPEPYQSEHDGYLQNYLTTSEAKIIGVGREVTALRKDGTTFPINLSVSEVLLGNRRLFTGIIHDISQRRSLEKQILEISEAEQRRIGQDLHDGLCQYLVGIGFSAEMIASRVEAQVPEQAEEIRKIGQLMRNAATQARDLSHGLNPVGMGEHGVANALETLARQISELFQVACVFDSPGKINIPDRAVAMHIYRIAQEAVSNAVRHGHAQHIRISLKQVKAYWVLTIEDDGNGMKDAGTSGMGLKTMSYRARIIGGTLQVANRAGRGTLITCRLPVTP